MRPGSAFLILACTACVPHHQDFEPQPLPITAGPILLTSIDLPEAGTMFGGHFSGKSFDVQQASYQMTDAVRERWGREARLRGEALLRGAGFRVFAMGPSTSDALQLRGVQYGLSGRVTNLAVRSSGAAEPYRIEAQVDVEWELLDLGSGSAVFGRNIRQSLRDVGTVDTIVARTMDAALARLIADSTFRYALAATRADPDAGAPLRFARAVPESGQFLDIARGDINPSNDSSVVGRIAAGLATVRNADNFLGTAFLITRDGLAVTTARAVRDERRLRARLANGVERPVRVLRRNRALDIALIQISCEQCETVDWDAPEGIDVYTPVVAVGAPADNADGLAIGFGRVGGRWGMASGLTLELPDGSPVNGGDPVARTTSGRVFAVVSARPGRRTVLLMSEVLAALHIRLP